ncbi:hypothetical protein KSS87_009493 [Heliosperma pusillum]|nr:hypothetical protein KSS87_009493 [Heliosperma pusillum]
MLVPENLGFFRLALVFIFLVFPAFAFFCRHKWRLEVARREEINRLLVLAAEESARAELEAQHAYCIAPAPEPEAPAPVTSQRICAVCYNPTPNRCAQCKSVHYCSGKCQIIHWRQGHKEECQALRAGSEINDEASSFIGSGPKQPYHDDYITHVEDDGSPYDEQGITALEELGFPLNDDVGAANISLHEEEPCSMSVLRDNSSLYGVSTSILNNGICIDDSSSDDDSVHDLNSESCDSSSTFESFETASSDSHVEQIKPLETETSMEVDVDASKCISASAGLKDGALSGKTSSLGSRVSHPDKNSIKPSICASGFWEGTLPTSKTRTHVPNNNFKPKPMGASNEKLPDLKSTAQFSAELSGRLSSDKMVSNNYASARTSKLIAVTTSSNKESAAHIRHPSSMLSSFKEHDTRINGVDVNRVKPGKVGVAADTLEDISLPYSLSRAHHQERNNQDTQKSLLSSKVSLSLQSNGISSSGLKEDTAVAAKSITASGNAAMPPQTASGPVGLKASMLKVFEQLRTPRSSKQVDGAGRNGEKAVFEYDLFVKLYHWNKVELRPCGLINCGNSCYANVVLQCLAFTPPLTAYLLQGLHSKTCVKKEWCLSCEFERLVLKANEVGHPQSPIGILSQIQKIGSHLTNGREEDAHEFLRYSIETMQSICLQEAEVKAFSSLKEETTLMGLTFGGYLRSKIKCTRCHGKSVRQERMMDLTVEIGGDVETLEDALRQFTGTENLDGENKYHCGRSVVRLLIIPWSEMRCNSFEKAKKKLSILEAPNVLTIALKRYQSGKFGKLNKSIRFPEILNLAPYMRGGSDKAPIYRLYGVVVHLDIMNASFSGHYVCYVRNAQNKWFKIDDSMVAPVELDRVLNKGAYMLFYSRCSPRAPRSIRSTLVSRDVPIIKIKNSVVDRSHSNGRINTSRQKEFSAHLTHTPDDLRNLSYIHQDETSLPPPHNNSGNSSSDSSTIFTHSDGVSTSTDSTRDSFSADDFSEYIFGYNAFSRSSDLDTSSSSSSSSSSPLYSNHSPLSDSERYASALPDWNVHQTCRHEEPGPVDGATFLHSNSRKQVRNLVNISSREADPKRLGRANPLENGKSGVHLRSSSRKKAD